MWLLQRKLLLLQLLFLLLKFSLQTLVQNLVSSIEMTSLSMAKYGNVWERVASCLNGGVAMLWLWWDAGLHCCCAWL